MRGALYRKEWLRSLDFSILEMSAPYETVLDRQTRPVRVKLVNFCFLTPSLIYVSGVEMGWLYFLYGGAISQDDSINLALPPPLTDFS